MRSQEGIYFITSVTRVSGKRCSSPAARPLRSALCHLEPLCPPGSPAAPGRRCRLHPV